MRHVEPDPEASPVDNAWLQKNYALLGKAVSAVYSEDPFHDVVGILHWFDDTGEFCVLTEQGFRFCWPLLKIAECGCGLPSAYHPEDCRVHGPRDRLVEGSPYDD